MFNKAADKIRTSYAKVEQKVKSAYNQTAQKVSNAGTAIKKWTIENKETLLKTAKNLQDGGDKIATVGAVAAVAGAPIAGVGAAPGATLAAAGKAASLTGVVLEVVVEAVAGSSKNALITAGNEAVYTAVGQLGSKVVDNLIPGPTPDISKEISTAAKQVVGLVESGVKKETDKVVDRFKDVDKK